jgi:zinc transporter, ZIP family
MAEVFVGSVLSALSTGAGALVVLFINQSVTHRWMDMLLAFSAGIMMAASTIGLIPEALKLGGFGSLTIGVFFWGLSVNYS